MHVLARMHIETCMFIWRRAKFDQNPKVALSRSWIKMWFGKKIYFYFSAFQTKFLEISFEKSLAYNLVFAINCSQNFQNIVVTFFRTIFELYNTPTIFFNVNN